jgi:hypothetical protein
MLMALMASCASTTNAIKARAAEKNPELMFLARTIRETWALATESLNPGNVEDVKPYFKLAAKTVILAEDSVSNGKSAEWTLIQIAWGELQRQLSVRGWSPPIDFDASIALISRMVKKGRQ